MVIKLCELFAFLLLLILFVELLCFSIIILEPLAEKLRHWVAKFSFLGIDLCLNGSFCKFMFDCGKEAGTGQICTFMFKACCREIFYTLIVVAVSNQTHKHEKR